MSQFTHARPVCMFSLALCAVSMFSRAPVALSLALNAIAHLSNCWLAHCFTWWDVITVAMLLMAVITTEYYVAFLCEFLIKFETTSQQCIDFERLLCFHPDEELVVFNDLQASAYGLRCGFWFRWTNFRLMVTVAFFFVHLLNFFSASKNVDSSKLSSLKSTISSPFCKSPWATPAAETSAIKIGRSPYGEHMPPPIVNPSQQLCFCVVSRS